MTHQRSCRAERTSIVLAQPWQQFHATTAEPPRRSYSKHRQPPRAHRQCDLRSSVMHSSLHRIRRRTCTSETRASSSATRQKRAAPSDHHEPPRRHEGGRRVWEWNPNFWRENLHCHVSASDRIVKLVNWSTGQSQQSTLVKTANMVKWEGQNWKFDRN